MVPLIHLVLKRLVTMLVPLENHCLAYLECVVFGALMVLAVIDSQDHVL